MSSERIQSRIGPEILELLDLQKAMFLSSITPDGDPYASYAPFAIEDDGFYVLLSELALHAVNLLKTPKAAALIVEDESHAKDLFARKRVSYSFTAQPIPRDSEQWHNGVACLVARHGERSQNLSQLGDFHLFKLVVTRGRFVKGFGKAFEFSGPNVCGESMVHLRDGHLTTKA
ncbi:heme utilization protein HutZ [Alginatibacterium sediminis]|uniref:Heme utilization protein HutZ n=1 Tax=Alginatibacterium sediminis TaxID=2164068 RepID=A0A420EL99_9ALTE|nr:pyridoxamine 5'-phosphate oxidase family protein [Alginatibacterium sediminis]RKF21453.1 heme utilization protein HutZ [Alginatibacterium sediminis]